MFEIYFDSMSCIETVHCTSSSLPNVGFQLRSHETGSRGRLKICEVLPLIPNIEFSKPSGFLASFCFQIGELI